MTISVPSETFEGQVTERLGKAAGQIRLPGFRPGKVPMKVVKRRYGAGVRQEVLGEIIQSSFYEAATQEQLKPAGGPAIEAKVDEEGKDFEYVATFEVYPEIELADFSAVEINKQVAEIEDADVDTMIDALRKQQAEWSVAERAAQDGDRVNIDFEGFLDGEAFEGGKADGHELVLGSGTMIPGFEAGLEGASAGEEKELNLAFPEGYHAENLAGKEVVFKVKVNSVSASELPELNEAFFAKFGMQDKDLDGFKAEIRRNMQRELKQALQGKVKQQVLDALVEKNDVAAPKALVDGEVDRLREQAVQQFGGGANLDPKTLPAELFTAQAEKRVLIGLLVGEVIRANELKTDADRVRAMIEEMAESYEEPQQVVDYYYGNQEMLSQVQALVLEEQVVDLLLGQATVAEEKVSYEEAIKPAAPKAEELAEESAE